MLFMQKIRNGELGERRLRYSPSLMRSIKESEARNHNVYGARFIRDGLAFGIDEEDRLGIVREEKKFKMVSDKTANTLSQWRDKASALMGKKEFS